ncbi:calpain-B isoform X1 [Exaiptasia diaphana]|uniref:Uncharacterized protein n=1 Tax=Exaiptasia diaphana TaxID=2652724 RepID=A0A913X0D8_EXADI|nr:calpain-B isoform X1 [Exaiptasia diaphana]KXJ29972.1 Calpain-B [Exaiptasia diaphana]
MDEIRRRNNSRNPYRDYDFDAVDTNMFYSRALPPHVKIDWKRPWELVDNPKLIIGGASRLDIKQGMLGDCWLLAGIGALTQHDKLLNRVLITDYVADNKDPNYTGAVRFNFWQYGEWKEVITDDRLPSRNGKLVFVQSAEKNEFWSSLLEKAYAKVHGSYEALKGGQTGEALEDFTGGLSESYDLKKPPEDLFAIMQKAMARSSLMGCSIAAKPNEIEAKGAMGLVKGHAYTVTGVHTVNYRGRPTELVRVRNPWGNDREWEGDWGDKSSQWRELNDSEKRKLGLTFEDDGEFWMSFKDFVHHFTTLEICMLGGDSAVDKSKVAFESRTEQGCWSAASAGGCRNYINTFASNPQYLIKLEDADDDEDDLCTVVVALMQKDRRKEKRRGMKMLTIGYSIYKEDPQNPGKELNKEFFMYNQSVARSPSYINSREVVGRHKLPPGNYFIIPSTFKPQERGNFILRIFSEKAHKTGEVDTSTSFTSREDRRVKITNEQNSSLDAKFRQIFDDVCGDDDEIDAYELQRLLTSAFKKDLGSQEFSLECSRSTISMYDEDLSGKLGFKEFKETIMQVKKWQAIFNSKDADRSGSMDAYELKSALREGGFQLSNKIVDAVATRFANKSGQVSLDDFIQIMVRMNVLYNNFEKHGRHGQATYNLAEFLVENMVL